MYIHLRNVNVTLSYERLGSFSYVRGVKSILGTLKCHVSTAGKISLCGCLVKFWRMCVLYVLYVPCVLTRISIIRSPRTIS